MPLQKLPKTVTSGYTALDRKDLEGQLNGVLARGYFQPKNTHHWGKYHCMAGLRFELFGEQMLIKHEQSS